MQRAFKASAATNRTVFEKIMVGRNFGSHLSLVWEKQALHKAAAHKNGS